MRRLQENIRIKLRLSKNRWDAVLRQSRRGSVKGAKSHLRVQSSSLSNLKRLKGWTGSGAKRLFRHAETGYQCLQWGHFPPLHPVQAPLPQEQPPCFALRSAYPMHAASARTIRSPSMAEPQSRSSVWTANAIRYAMQHWLIATTTAFQRAPSSRRMAAIAAMQGV